MNINQPIRRTLSEWKVIHAPTPAPIPTYTEEEYLAIVEKGKPPFYQLKEEFPGITYDEGTAIYTLDGRLFVSSRYGWGIDLHGNQQIVLAWCNNGANAIADSHAPLVRNRASYQKFLEWYNTKYVGVDLHKERKPRRSFWRTN